MLSWETRGLNQAKLSSTGAQVLVGPLGASNVGL